MENMLCNGEIEAMAAIETFIQRYFIFPLVLFKKMSKILFCILGRDSNLDLPRDPGNLWNIVFRVEKKAEERSSLKRQLVRPLSYSFMERNQI